ncbi:hypothetical protein GH714_040015 [Hevea brasiliensis]|uniref:Uncharacterized protein n=1 Tax=Hevea brasiliensis TaxID=3981 RepID=A0A6A6MSW7_HEVBR|nr:hypothetical protein GH714_040015 [Hevea brasiliensis]
MEVEEQVREFLVLKGSQMLFKLSKQAQLCLLRSNGSNAASILDANVGQANNSTPSTVAREENLTRIVDACVSATPSISETEQAQERVVAEPANDSSSLARIDIQDSKTSDAIQMIHGGPYNGRLIIIFELHASRVTIESYVTDNGREMLGEEEFPEAKVNFQEIFLGHASPISRCRFSASGNNIASASVDGTVRIWTYDSSIPTSRNVTIYCGAEIMSLDWECKSGRLLLIGTADGGIKGWNVDAKRVVCDLNTSEVFRSVLDLKCSPVEPVFVSAAASRRQGSNYLDSLGFASLTVWNMKTWRVMLFLLVRIHLQSLPYASITMGRF